jgi:hypothetical protein
MWSLALCSLLIVGLSSALPLSVVPLLKSEGEKLTILGDEVKNVNGNGDGRMFIVQVSEPQQERPIEQPKREFPWPYPPVFESVLPEEAKQQLVYIYGDSSLTSEDRVNQINAVFDSLPREVIEQLPLPSEYYRLPADVYNRILYVHTAPGFKWAERQQLIRDIVESLPVEQRQLMHTPRIGGPPPGFELVLAPTVYKQLLTVHHNPRLTKEEKATLITRIMRQVPTEQINQLPLPSGMNQLPVELQQRLRSLVYDYSVEQPIRAQRVREFVESLPLELRPHLR